MSADDWQEVKCQLTICSNKIYIGIYFHFHIFFVNTSLVLIQTFWLIFFFFLYAYLLWNERNNLCTYFTNYNITSSWVRAISRIDLSFTRRWFSQHIYDKFNYILFLSGAQFVRGLKVLIFFTKKKKIVKTMIFVVYQCSNG